MALNGNLIKTRRKSVIINKSKTFLKEMSQIVPGGASSNARCGIPIAAVKGRGSELIDMDGNRYIDYILGFGPILLGHAHPKVAQAVSDAVQSGTTFAMSNELELRAAQKIVALCPSVEMVRFCNSGTDAAVTAYRIACSYTGKSMVIKIEGDYNGSLDVLLYDAPGSDASQLGNRPLPASTGISQLASENVITVPFNNATALKSILEKNREKIAAVFMEPILGNTAAIMPLPGYLQAVRHLCYEYGVILVFDEVKTGFRVALGGAQEHFGVYSDLTMLGKAVANGLPLAAIGGKRELMELIFPGGVHHCGTYFGNLPCVAAADAVLSILENVDYLGLKNRGERLASGICNLLAAEGIPAHWHGIGSMFGITIGTERPCDYRSWWLHTDRQFWMQVANQLREYGVLTDGFIGLFFLSFAHTDEDVNKTLIACEKAIRSCKCTR